MWDSDSGASPTLPLPTPDARATFPAPHWRRQPAATLTLATVLLMPHSVTRNMPVDVPACLPFPTGFGGIWWYDRFVPVVPTFVGSIHKLPAATLYPFPLLSSVYCA